MFDFKQIIGIKQIYGIKNKITDWQFVRNMEKLSSAGFKFFDAESGKIKDAGQLNQEKSDRVSEGEKTVEKLGYKRDKNLRRIEHCKNKIEKLKMQKGILARFSFEYRTAKMIMANKKKENKMIKKQVKRAYKKLKKDTEEYRKFEKQVNKYKKEHKNEIKFAMYYYENKATIRNSLVPEQYEMLNNFVKGIQYGQQVPDIEEYLKIIKDLVKQNKTKGWKSLDVSQNIKNQKDVSKSNIKQDRNAEKAKQHSKNDKQKDDKQKDDKQKNDKQKNDKQKNDKQKNDKQKNDKQKNDNLNRQEKNKDKKETSMKDELKQKSPYASSKIDRTVLEKILNNGQKENPEDTAFCLGAMEETGKSFQEVLEMIKTGEILKNDESTKQYTQKGIEVLENSINQFDEFNGRGILTTKSTLAEREAFNLAKEYCRERDKIQVVDFQNKTRKTLRRNSVDASKEDDEFFQI